MSEEAKVEAEFVAGMASLARVIMGVVLEELRIRGKQALEVGMAVESIEQAVRRSRLPLDAQGLPESIEDSGKLEEVADTLLKASCCIKEARMFIEEARRLIWEMSGKSLEEFEDLLDKEGREQN